MISASFQDDRAGSDDLAVVPAATASAATADSAAAATAAATAAIQDAMVIVADEDKAAYVEALTKVPELVQRESDPTRFLECEGNDPWKAAKRLACYWKQRKNIFGPERAFLPLHQTGGATAALNELDLELLNTSYLVILPNDKKGRSVMASDRTRFAPEHSFPHYFESKLRLLFYIFSIMSENKKSQQDGIVFMTVIAMAPDAELSKTFFKRIMEYSIGLLNYFAPFASCYQGKTDDEVIRQLKAAGFSKSNIPEWMGGSWKLEEFEKWKRQRVRIEQDLQITAEDKLQRKRKVNAILSRQKRARQKSQFVMLQEECATLRASNDQLAGENRQLEQHLEYACSEAAILEYLEQRMQTTTAASSADDEHSPTSLNSDTMGTTTTSPADLLTDDLSLCDVFN